MSKKSKKEAEAAEAKATLLKLLNPGDDVYALVTNVASSGMSRHIKLLVVDKKRKIANITGWVSTLMDSKWNDDDSMTVSGCGMDMCFHAVYSLSRKLWPDGYECTGEGCESNDHSNGDREYGPHQHGDGGYALVYGRL